MKKVLSIILVLAMILSMSACGGGKKESEEVKAQDLVMGTGSTGGTYFALGGAMANAINNKLKDKKISITALKGIKAIFSASKAPRNLGGRFLSNA